MKKYLLILLSFLTMNIEGMQDPDTEGVVMIMGATSDESDRFEASEEFRGKNLVFWSLEAPKGPRRYKNITADFNDIEKVRGALEPLGKINTIWFDRYTFYYTAWTEDHLRLFYDKLAHGGSLNYEPGSRRTMMGFTPGSVSADNPFSAMLREICGEANEKRMLSVCWLVTDFRYRPYLPTVDELVRDIIIPQHLALLRQIFQVCEVREGSYPFPVSRMDDTKTEGIPFIRAIKS